MADTQPSTCEEIAKLIYAEIYLAVGFDSYPPPWEDLEDCLVRQSCLDAAQAVLTYLGQ
jgi:hypothetical protein